MEKYKRKLSTKRKRFIGEVLAGESQTQAAINAGYKVANRRSACNLASELMKHPQVISEIDKQLQLAGFDDEFIGKTLFEIVEMMKFRKGKTSDALRALDMILKLRELYPAEKKRIERYDIRAQFQGKSHEEIKEAYDKFKEDEQRFLRKEKILMPDPNCY